MTQVTMHTVAACLRSYNHEGVTFWDLNSIMSDGTKWRCLIDTMAKACRTQSIDMIVGLDARGFLISGALSYVLGVGKVMGRKKGKLPGETISRTYGLEYREKDELEIQVEYIRPGMRVLIVDDVLATGGTALAATQLVEKLGATVVGVLVAIELPHLGGRVALEQYPVHSTISIIEDTPHADVEYCVDVIAEHKTGEVTLVQRLTEPSGLAFPGGHIDPWEPASKTAPRELKEETGLIATNLTSKGVLCSPDRDPRGHKVSLLYEASVAGQHHSGEPGKTKVVTKTLTEWSQTAPDEFAFDAHGVLEKYILSEAA